MLTHTEAIQKQFKIVNKNEIQVSSFILYKGKPETHIRTQAFNKKLNKTEAHNQ